MKPHLLKNTLTLYAGTAALVLGLIPAVLELFVPAYQGSTARTLFDASYMTSIFCAAYWTLNTLSRVCSRAWNNFTHEEAQRVCIEKAQKRTETKKQRRKKRAARKQRQKERRAAQRSHKGGSQSE